MTQHIAANPLVSVVMPVYNHARYVTDALKSIVSQDWRPLEIIVIDDGSKDESLENLKRCVLELPKEEGLSVHLTARENRGAHNTINEGLRQATGDYIAILNSDDYFLPGRIRKCIDTAITHHARFVFTYVDPIDDDGNELSAEHRWRHWYSDLKMQELDLAPNVSNLLLRYNIGVSTGNFVFHRSLLDDVGYFEDYRYAHDLDYMLRVSLLEEPVIVREKLYAYRVHANNTIGESDERITNEVAGIVAKYLKSSVEKKPINPIAPTLNRDCFSMASVPWTPHLEKAIDSLMYDPSVIAKSGEKETSQNKVLNRAPESSKHKATVTLVSHELSRTGAPILLRDVASALHGLDVSTRVISLGGGPLEEDYADMHSPVVTEDRVSNVLGRAGNFLSRLSTDARVPSLLRSPLRLSAKLSAGVGSRLRMANYRAKVSANSPLLINSFASWPLALPLLEKWKGPAFWYIHETYEPTLVMRTARELDRLKTLVDSQRVTFLFGSDATRTAWAREGYDGEVYYWSGIDTTTSVAKPLEAGDQEKRVILSVQSTGPRKGTRSLIEGFAIGCQEGLIPDDTELHIIGAHSPSRNALSRDLLVRILNDDIRGRVHLIPNLAPNELGQHYAAASVYVQSSTMECLPLALLNAMACGLPIVSTDADGCREAILNEETGLLIPPRQPRLMAEALAGLFNNPEHAQRMGRNARRRFEEKFALETTATKLVNRLTETS